MLTVVKIFCSLLAAVICSWPIWLYLFGQHMLDPHGFWQRLVVLGAGIYLLGAAQIVFGIGFIMLLLFIWGWKK